MSATTCSVLRLDTRCLLGEGIVWHQADAAWPEDGFFFVDIHGRRLHFVRLDGSGHRQWETPQRIGWVLASRGEQHLLAGLQSGVARFNLGASFQHLGWVAQLFAGQPALRLNDAKADAQGRVWAGSLNNDNEHLPHGMLHRISPEGEVAVVDTGYRVANGPTISGNGRMLLHTDSALQTIYAFNLDPITGELSHKRRWRRFSVEEGYPDGMTTDAEGCTWVAHWGAGCISRFGPDAQLLTRVSLPTSNVTSLSFGGPDLDRLWVTTARVGLTAEALAAEHLAGGVFEVMGHGTRGLPACKAGF